MFYKNTLDDWWEVGYRFLSFGFSASMNLLVTISLLCLDCGPAPWLLALTKAEDGDDCFFALVPYRYRPPTFHVQAWYDEVKDYSFSYPQECNPYCPFKCSGPVCTHYTQVTSHGLHLWSTFGGHLGPDFVSRLQLVWATSSRIGCAVNLCYNMNVWGQIWAKAVYLVCNYSPK